MLRAALVRRRPCRLPLPADAERGNANTAQHQRRNRSRLALGLTARQTPATVEVIDKQTIEDRGLRTTTEVAKAAVGVTAGDAPGAPAIFSMRGFAGDQINTLYNGIRIGPATMTGRPMDTANLERVEILKGPASLLSGEGATGGAVNYVTKSPHTGPIVNEAFAAFDSFKGYRAGYRLRRQHAGQGLDYRFDVTHSNNVGFIDDTYAGSAIFRASSTIASPTISRSGARPSTSRTRTASTGARRWCRPMRRALFRPAASFGAVDQLLSQRPHRPAELRSRSMPGR